MFKFIVTPFSYVKALDLKTKKEPFWTGQYFVYRKTSFWNQHTLSHFYWRHNNRIKLTSVVSTFILWPVYSWITLPIRFKEDSVKCAIWCLLSYKRYWYWYFFRNACTKSGSLRFSQFSGCWLILSVYILMSFDFPFVRLFGVR